MLLSKACYLIYVDQSMFYDISAEFFKFFHEPLQVDRGIDEDYV